MNVDEKSPDKRALTQDQYLMNLFEIQLELRILRTKEQEYRNQYLTVQLLTVNTKDSANPNERPGVHSALKPFVRKLFFKKDF